MSTDTTAATGLVAVHGVSELTGFRLAKVNLLPPEIKQARRLKKVKGVLAAAVVVTLAAAAGGYVLAQNSADSAAETLATEQARTSVLQADQAQYAEVPRVLAEVESAEDAQQAAMATDVNWYSYFSSMSLTLPEGVWLTTVTATVAGPGGTTGAAPVPVAGSNPFATPGIGTVIFTGTATSYDAVAAWLDTVITTGQEVDGSQGWADAYAGSIATTETEGETTMDFTATVVVTDAALSGDFTREAQR